MAKKRPMPDQQKWVDAWLSAVETGRSTMSQRSLPSIVKHVGSVKALATAARKRGVHLVQLEDDQGRQLVAASMKPFKVLS